MPKRIVIKPDDPTIRVCLYRQSECTLTLSKRCPIAGSISTATDFTEIKSYIHAADYCKKRARKLTRDQHNAHKFGVMV